MIHEEVLHCSHIGKRDLCVGIVVPYFAVCKRNGGEGFVYLVGPQSELPGLLEGNDCEGANEVGAADTRVE